MDKVYVKIKDPSGSYYLAEQDAKINKSTPAYLDRTERVDTALANGVIVAIEKKEFDTIVRETKAINTAVADSKAAEKKDPITAITDLVNKAMDHKVIVKDGDKFKFKKTFLGNSLEEVVEKLMGNTDLKDTISADVVRIESAGS